MDTVAPGTTLPRTNFSDEPEYYRLSAAGYLAELDRMTLEIRDYLWSHPAEAKPGLAA